MTPRTGGQLLVDCLEAQGVSRVFCVPGESFLAVLDALHDSRIDTVVARQEGGAAMMAEADGKMTGRPGICFVTRGPGATNAAAGLHVAQQDSTPMILFIGQIARAHSGRDAFQELDYRALFGGIAKRVETIDSAERIPEFIARAWSTAMAGRPGPVVLVLPEDMLRDAAKNFPGKRIDISDPAPTAAQTEWLGAMLAEAQRPFAIFGGSRWTPEAVRAASKWAQAWRVPVGVSFRRQGLFDHRHACYAGDVGLGINPALRQRIEDCDLLLLIGGRFSENPSQGFSLLGIPDPGKRLVHVHPGPEELGRIYTPHLAMNATAGTFFTALEALDAPYMPVWAGWTAEANAAYFKWSDHPPDAPGDVTMSATIAYLRDAVPASAIVTNGAGNYASWLHRYYRFRAYGTQLAPTSGSMGYGLPAAIAAALRYPKREVFCLAGDGCLQMTVQEMATAAETGARVRLLVCDNGQYGTIRMHQARDYPGRISATQLRNPDFAALGAAYGWQSETVENDSAFPKALARARSADGPALLHLPISPLAIAPGKLLDAET